MKILALTLMAIVGLFLGINIAYAQSFDAASISAATGAVLDTTVDSIVTVVLTFFEENFPLIVILAVAVGLVFWLVRKAIRATKGSA